MDRRAAAGESGRYTTNRGAPRGLPGWPGHISGEGECADPDTVPQKFTAVAAGPDSNATQPAAAATARTASYSTAVIEPSGVRQASAAVLLWNALRSAGGISSGEVDTYAVGAGAPRDLAPPGRCASPARSRSGSGSRGPAGVAGSGGVLPELSSGAHIANGDQRRPPIR